MLAIDIAYKELNGISLDRLKATMQAEGTEVVSESTEARTALLAAARKGAHIVIVVREGEPVGIISPLSVAQYLNVNVHEVAENLVETRVRPSALAAIRPPLLWCAVGEHYTYDSPCPEHSVVCEEE